MTLDFNEYLTRINNGQPSKVLDLPEEAKKWLSIREAEASRIDPDAAEVRYDYGRWFGPIQFLSGNARLGVGYS